MVPYLLPYLSYVFTGNIMAPASPLFTLDPETASAEMHMEQTPFTNTHRTPSGLGRAEFEELVFRAIAEWDRGDPLPSLLAILERGSPDQYAEAVNRICRHDDREKDREVERQVTRLRAQRAD